MGLDHGVILKLGRSELNSDSTTHCFNDLEDLLNFPEP